MDVLVLMQEPVQPLTYLRAKPIGVMHMMDSGEKDEKLIAAAVDDPEYSYFEDISELPQHRMAEIRRFFQDYKVLEGKTVQVEKEMGGKDEAKKCLSNSMDMYASYIADCLRRGESA